MTGRPPMRIVSPTGRRRCPDRDANTGAVCQCNQRKNRLTPLWARISGGCHLNRPIVDMIARAAFKIEQLDTGYLPGPKIMTFLSEGSARPRYKGTIARLSFGLGDIQRECECLRSCNIELNSRLTRRKMAMRRTFRQLPASVTAFRSSSGLPSTSSGSAYFLGYRRLLLRRWHAQRKGSQG